MGGSSQNDTEELIRVAVVDRYSSIGTNPSGEETIPTGRSWAERLGYPPRDLDEVPTTALTSFTGIGAPLFDAELVPGERALDLGCGAGLDSILMARRVTPNGHVYGVDLARGMVTAARRAVAEASLPNVTILQAAAEHIPLPAASTTATVIAGGE